VPLTRRQFLESAALTTAGLLAGVKAEGKPAPAAPVRVGMCDWNLGQTGRLEALSVAKRLGLDGVEASVSFPGPGQQLRDPKVADQYRATARRLGVAIPSLALGVLNEVPLASQPKAALWLADSIEAARRVGARVILVAFFGAGAINMADRAQLDRLVGVLQELGPRAQQAGVILGLENTLSAPDNLALLERVGSPGVQVYYDLMNSADQGRDVPAELRALGPHLCQVHVKDSGGLLSEVNDLDFPACARALHEIGYRGWYVLETASPRGLEVDTTANLRYVRSVFA